MKIPSNRILLSALLIAGVVAPALAQEGPKLGEAPALQMVPPPPPAAPNATYGNRAGTLNFKITITIKSAIPATQKIYCLAYASAYGMQSNSEQATKVATRSGNTATCTVSIPYSWVGVDITTGAISTSLSIYSGTNDLTARYASRSLTPILPIPPNNTTKTIIQAMTL